jgi:hypothetical protein
MDKVNEVGRCLLWDFEVPQGVRLTRERDVVLTPSRKIDSHKSVGIGLQVGDFCRDHAPIQHLRSLHAGIDLCDDPNGSSENGLIGEVDEAPSAPTEVGVGCYRESHDVPGDVEGVEVLRGSSRQWLHYLNPLVASEDDALLVGAYLVDL